MNCATYVRMRYRESCRYVPREGSVSMHLPGNWLAPNNNFIKKKAKKKRKTYSQNAKPHGIDPIQK